MDRRRLGLAALLLLGALTGCGQEPQAEVAEVALPIVVQAQSLVQTVFVPHVALTPQELYPNNPPPVDPTIKLATDLIVRWEVSGEATYTRKWQGVICPGEQSGPTWGIGYDGGHQTRVVIAGAWRKHPQVQDLLTTSEAIGSGCTPVKDALKHVRTSYALAYGVFAVDSLPRYCSAARRAYGPAYDDAPPGVKAALCSLTYNRGSGMTGSRRSEMRTIRDVCLPADKGCVAIQLRSMCRLWQGAAAKGLCARRFDEATTAEAG